MPRTPYQVYRIGGFGGGLNVADAPEALADGETRQLENVVLPGTGRVTSRPTLGRAQTLPGPIVAVIPFETVDVSMVVLTYEATATAGQYQVKLYTVTSKGVVNATAVGTLAGWGALTKQPKVSWAVVNERLFICDSEPDKTKNAGLTIYQPNEATAFFQPEFDFDGNGLPAKAFPTLVGSYNNMVLMVGYGSESELNRPETVRFSYPGLEADEEAGGDAGTGGSANLFARDDYFMVGTRGVPVVGMAPARGRLVMATPYSTHVLYGFDRDSFNLELLDPVRGLVNYVAITEAGGQAYWWSPFGPMRWGGAAVDDIGQKIGPLVERIDPASVRALHDPSHFMVLFLYREQGENGDASRYLSYDYRRGVWVHNRFGGNIKISTTGYSRYGEHAVSLVNPPLTPLGAPTNLAEAEIGVEAAILTWLPVDARSETLLYLRKSLGTYELVHTFPPRGENRWQVQLEASTGYDWYVSHRRGGVEVAAAARSFTTKAVGAINAPILMEAKGIKVESKDPVDGRMIATRPGIRLFWQPPIHGNIYFYEVERSPDNVTWEVLTKDALQGQSAQFRSDYVDTKGLSWNQTYYYRIRVRTQAGELSAYSASVSGTTPESTFTTPNDGATGWSF